MDWRARLFAVADVLKRPFAARKGRCYHGLASAPLREGGAGGGHATRSRKPVTISDVAPKNIQAWIGLSAMEGPGP